MSRRSLRDELRDVFDQASEPAHPALSARIRERLSEAPSPGQGVPRLAAAIAVVAAVALVAGLVVAGRHAALPPTVPSSTAPPRTPAPTPTPVPGVVATPAPSATGPAATPGATPGSGFRCATQTGGGAGGPAGATGPVGITAVRAGPQAGYDRFVVEFNGPVPHYQVRAQSGTSFTEDASGRTVVLAGSAGLVVTLQGASGYGTYRGPSDLRPTGTAVVEEARQLGDFESVVTWGIGLSHPSCFRVATLTGPARLVVDVQA